MEKVHRNFFLFFFLGSLSVVIPTLHANIADFDDYWRNRAEQARKANLQAFHEDPEEVTANITSHVNKVLMGTNSTRRNLKKKGTCLATNPIDRCWRCKGKWAKNRKRLADCALGFGHGTTGGKDGPYYIVTDSSDSDMMNPKPGTLRHAVIQEGPLWIIFSTSMVIRLNQELIMTSNKTIDGRGAHVHIAAGAGITLQYISNVIIHNIHIHDIVAGTGGTIRDSVDHFGFRTQSDGDGISIFGASHIWIDHVSMYKCQDGMIDAIMGSTAITISNSHFTHHNEVMLFGASNSYSADQIMQITVAFNHFGKGLVQRMPRCRWGFFHVVNNDYTHWEMYALGGSSQPTIISQGNRFIAPPNNDAKEVTKREYAMESEWSSWKWRSEGDLMVNGAFFVQSGPPLSKKPYSRLQMIKARPGTYVKRLTRFAGTLKCQVDQTC